LWEHCPKFVAAPKLAAAAPRPSAIQRENVALSSRLVGDRVAEPSELRVQLPIKFRANPIERVAKEFPKVHFTPIDGLVKLPNVQSVRRAPSVIARAAAALAE
jgi:hypothetical protein